MVHYRDGPRGLGHASRRPFVLDHVGVTLNGRDAPLHVELKLVRAYLRFRHFGPDHGLDLRIRGPLAGSGRDRRSLMGRRNRRGTLLRAEKRGQDHFQKKHSHI
jgi:hypothetical protein